MRTALSCFRGFISSARKTSKPAEIHESAEATSDAAAPATAASGAPLVDVSNLSAEWAASQFPVACITLGEHTTGIAASARRVTVLWHNAASLDIWERLTSHATNPALAEAILATLNGDSHSSAQQVVPVSGSTFAAAQPAAAAAARFTSELLAAVSVPVHISPVQFSTGPLGMLVPRAALLVCRAPLMPPRHIDATGPSSAAPGVVVRGRPPSTANLMVAAGGAAGFDAGGAAGFDAGGAAGEAGGERGSANGMAAHRQRDSMVAAHLPASITVFTLEGRVLHQNPASVQYMGPMPSTAPPPAADTTATTRPLPGSAPAPGASTAAAAAVGTLSSSAMVAAAASGGALTRNAGDAAAAAVGVGADSADGSAEGAEWGSGSLGLGVLGLIFRYEQAKLGQMLEVLLGRGAIWQGIVRVPSSEGLQRRLLYGNSSQLQQSLSQTQQAQQQAPPGSLGVAEGAAAAAVEAAGDDSLRRGSRPTFARRTQPGEMRGSDSQWQPQQAGQESEGPVAADSSQQQQAAAEEEDGEAEELEEGPLGQRHNSSNPRSRPSQEQDQQHQHQPGPNGTSQQQQQRPLSHKRSSSLEDSTATNAQNHHYSSHHLHNHHNRHSSQHLHLNSSGSHTAASPVRSGRDRATPNGNNNGPFNHHNHQRQLRAASGARAVGAVLLLTEGSEGASAAMAGCSGGQVHSTQDAPLGRGGAAAARSSVANVYDSEADPLATSTWTVLADPTSRGWPSNHLPLVRTTTVTNLTNPTATATSNQYFPTSAAGAGVSLRSHGAARISRRSRQSTPLNSPDRVREAVAGGGAASSEATVAALGLMRRWGSMTSAAAGARGPPALQAPPPGSVSGPQVPVGVAVHQRIHESELYAGAALAPGAGLVPGRSLDAASAAAAAATAVTAAAPMEGAAAGPSSPLPPMRLRERSHDGNGGGEGSWRNSATHGTLRKFDGYGAAVNHLHNHHNHTATAGGASANTAASGGISRVLVFANSLRSAPFAPAAAAASAGTAAAGLATAAPTLPSPQPGVSGGRHAHEAAAGGGGGGAVKRARSTSTLRRQSQSYEKGLASAVTAPAPPALDLPIPVGRRGAAGATAATTASAEPPPVLALSRPEMSALSALLRARRSSIMVAGPAPPPPPGASAGDSVGHASTSVGGAATAAEAPALIHGSAESSPPGPTEPSGVGTRLLAAPPVLGFNQRSTSGDCDGAAVGGTGGGSGAAPTAVMITTGDAELAMALLPYSQSLSVAPRNLATVTGGGSVGVGHAAGPGDDGDSEAGEMSTAAGAAAAEAAEEEEEERGDGAGGGGGGGGDHDVWHEISAVSALDPVTGAPVLVVTQVDVSAKVRAERHLVHVMCAERRLLLQLFPRHVLQHVVEANPLLGPGGGGAGGPGSGAGPAGPAGAGAGSFESLPREWLDGGDWRPVLRDCDKLATMHPQATVLFADIAGFDDICMELPPQRVLAFLNDLFAKFDNSIEPFGVHKMETIGGLFIVAGGLLREEEDGAVAVRERWDPLHAEKVFMFAKAMLNVAAKTKLPTLEQQPVKLRIGIHTGPVMSGIVGTRVPRFVLFGDTVNTASRMQTTATPGSVHVSEDTRALLPHESWTPTGGVQIKGKGLLNTYVWVPEDQIHYLVPPPEVTTPESTHTGGAATAIGNGSGAAAGVNGTGSGAATHATANCSGGAASAVAMAALFAGANGSRATPPPAALLMSTQDTSCTSSDVFLAQQLSFTSAIPPAVLLRGKSRLRNEGGFL